MGIFHFKDVIGHHAIGAIKCALFSISENAKDRLKKLDPKKAVFPAEKRKNAKKRGEGGVRVGEG